MRLLTDEEKAEADEVGRIRHERSWTKRRKDTVSPKPKAVDLAKHRVGTLGECAYGIYGLSGPWAKDIDTFHAKPDFQPDIEVRLGAQGYPNMWFREGDYKIKHRRFVAGVQHSDGHIRWHGWAYGHEIIDYPKSQIGNGPWNVLVHVEDLHRMPFHEPQPVGSIKPPELPVEEDYPRSAWDIDY